MSAQELDVLLQALRQGGPDLSASPEAARQGFEEMLSGIPVPADVAFERIELGGVPALASTTPGAATDKALIYLHGGAYVIGSAQGYRALSSALGRAAGARAISLDYRLAPEHPFPAAVDDAVAAYRALLGQGLTPGNIAVAGDSAGGGLTVAMLVAALQAGLPAPAAALAISPWVDLECAGGTIVSKAAEDPALTREGLQSMAALYLNGGSLRGPLASPIHADLTGLPPLLIQVGSAEILLDDATRLAAAAGAAGVETRLHVWPRMPHVWHAFGFMLGEGRDATAEAGAFIAARFGTSP